MHILENDDDIARGVARLTAIEPRFQRVTAVHGHPPLRRMAGGLPGLLRIVTEQLISLKAAEAIWQRLDHALRPFDACQIAALPDNQLMELGLSRAKARCFVAIAKAASTGSLDFSALHAAEDEQCLATLCRLPGIGPWTAYIYLLSAMGRADAWPAGDLALQVAAQHLLSLPLRPNPRAITALAEPWRPLRAVAAHLLWSHYRGLRGLSQAVV